MKRLLDLITLPFWIAVALFAYIAAGGAALTVTTGAGATNITSTSAAYTGAITGTNGLTNAVQIILVHGESAGLTSTNTDTNTWEHVVVFPGSYTNGENLVTNITTLTPERPHYYAVLGVESNTFAWSSITNFMTLAGSPTNHQATARSPVPLLIDPVTGAISNAPAFASANNLSTVIGGGVGIINVDTGGVVVASSSNLDYYVTGPISLTVSNPPGKARFTFGFDNSSTHFMSGTDVSNNFTTATQAVAQGNTLNSNITASIAAAFQRSALMSAGVALATPHANTILVAPNGVDTNDGLTYAVASLATAKVIAASLSPSPTNKVLIQLEAGPYRLAKAFSNDIANVDYSGKGGASILIFGNGGFVNSAGTNSELRDFAIVGNSTNTGTGYTESGPLNSHLVNITLDYAGGTPLGNFFGYATDLYSGGRTGVANLAGGFLFNSLIVATNLGIANLSEWPNEADQEQNSLPLVSDCRIFTSAQGSTGVRSTSMGSNGHWLLNTYIKTPLLGGSVSNFSIGISGDVWTCGGAITANQVARNVTGVWLVNTFLISACFTSDIPAIDGLATCVIANCPISGSHVVPICTNLLNSTISFCQIEGVVPPNHPEWFYHCIFSTDNVQTYVGEDPNLTPVYALTAPIFASTNGNLGATNFPDATYNGTYYPAGSIYGAPAWTNATGRVLFEDGDGDFPFYATGAATNNLDELFSRPPDYAHRSSISVIGTYLNGGGVVFGLPFSGAIPSLGLTVQDGFITAVGTGSFSATCIGGPRNPFWFNLGVTTIPINLTGASTVTLTNMDEIVQSNVFSTSCQNYQLSPATIRGLEAITWSGSNPSVATNDQSGFIYRVANGSLTVTAASPDCVQSTNLTFTTTGSGFALAITNGVTGSARKNATDAVNSRLLSGKSTSWLSSVSHSNGVNGTYVRNLNFWGSNLNITCVSVYNNTEGLPYQGDNNSRRCATLISSNVVLMANDYPCAVGSTTRFVTTNNVVVSRVISATTNAFADLTVGILDSPIPTNQIMPALVFGGPFTNKFPTIAYGIPVAGFTQDYQAYVFTVAGLTNNRATVVTPAITPLEQPFAGAIRSGDSGHPVLMFINTNPVVLCTWYTGGGGTATTGNTNELATAIASLGGAAFSNIDLSAFTSY